MKTKTCVKLLAAAIVVSGLCSCAARFYGGDKLAPDQLIRLTGTTDLYAVKINNSPTPAMRTWDILPGEHYVSAKYLSGQGWGGDQAKMIEFIGVAGRSYVLKASLEDGQAPIPPRTPGVLRDPERIVKWKMWVEDAETGEVLED